MDNSSIIKYTIDDMLEILGEPSQADGLHVHFNEWKDEKIPFTFPHRSNHYTIGFIISGRIKIQLDLITYELFANDVIVITPKTVMHILEMEGDCQSIIISFTLDFALQNVFKKNEVDSFNFYAANMIPKFTLEKPELQNFISLSNSLREKNINNDPDFFGSEIVSLAFNLLMYELAAAHKKKNADLRLAMSRKEALTFKFIKTLEKNFKRERSVQFYADSLFVTTGHLSKVLKEVSGKTAGQLIDDAIIMEARLLLAEPLSSIAQVADELEFGDQSLFGKFFKKNTGFSPSEYRNKKRNI
jgi:AraC family transcriptional activator of pobA